MIIFIGIFIVILGILIMCMDKITKWENKTTMKKFCSDTKIILTSLVVCVGFLTVTTSFIALELLLQK